MNCIALNIYTCPLCYEQYESLSNYSSSVCEKCVNTYGLTTEDDESMSIGFDRNKEFYNDVNGLISRGRECYVRGVPCYIHTENNIINIVCTSPIPRKINKLKKRTNT